MIDELRTEYDKARDHVAALRDCVDALSTLGLGAEWSAALRRSLRALTDQLDLAVDQAASDTPEPHRFTKRPPRLR